MGDAAVTSFRGEHEQRHVIVAPAGVAVFNGVTGRVNAAIAKVPIESHVISECQRIALNLEEDGTIGFGP